jgi:adenylate cyclase
MRLAPAEQPAPGWLRQITTLALIPANAAGAAAVYLYFTYVDPRGGRPPPDAGTAFLLFLGITGALLVITTYLGNRWTRPVHRWSRRLRAGEPPAAVPVEVRRRVLNAALTNGLLSLAAWFAAGLFYLVILGLGYRIGVFDTLRVFLVIVLVGGPVASALAFLVSEYHWRREVPLFFPDGNLERAGVLRLPIRVRLLVTFLLTSILPLLLMVMLDLSVQRHISGTLARAWRELVRAQLFLVGIAAVASTTMALLVARFIHRPIQALRHGMAQVAAGDLTARVPVRSTDELGELNTHFNSMVEQLRVAAQARELFGRYVSPAVARQALERGGGLDSTVVRATAMFVDLRGFTALAQRAAVQDVVRVLNAFYGTVERVCDRESGVVTQFLGDGVVVVFGGPLRPAADHARRAVRAAIALQWALVSHPALPGVGRLQAGIGICTGDMVAGNIRANERVVYTIVGDAVNQAARLQVKTRDLGTPILVTASTRDVLGESDGVWLRSRGALPLRGIEAPVEVFSVEM